MRTKPDTEFVWALVLAAVLGCGSDSVVAVGPASARVHDRILFDSKQDDPNGDIYSISLDGTGTTRITSSPFVDICPSISPDGTEIAFFSSRDGDQLALHLMAADGSDVRYVDGPVYSGQCPRWSPDGSTIAYLRYEPAGAATITSLRLVSRNGLGARTITATDFNYYAAWSPDSRSLALLRYGPPADSTKFGIFTVSADGSNLTRIANNYGSQTSTISWSSDGGMLLTGCRDFSTGKSGICERSTDGTVIKSILPTVPGAYQPIAWSPVGKRILYTYFPNGPLGVIEADGSTPIALLSGALAVGTVESAVWSPDAKSVAAAIYYYGTTELVVVNADGTGARQLTNNSYSESHLSWAPIGG